MNSNDLLSPESSSLLKSLRQLQRELDDKTERAYSRINPFMENITDWREKGATYVSEGTVCFDSATLIGKIEAGSNCWIGPDCLIDGSGGLKIGDFCIISSGTHIYTHDTVKWALSGGQMPYHHAPVEIGNNVFIGAQSVIVAGVSIGDHSLICANATVTKNVPPFSIVAGTPAKPIGRVHLDDEGNVGLVYYDRQKEG